MKIHEALSDPHWRDGTLWARPLGWVGLGRAVFAYAGGINVPDTRGGHSWTPTIDDVLGDWELVDPKLVNLERAEWMERINRDHS